MGEDFSVTSKPNGWQSGVDPGEVQDRHDDEPLLGFDPSEGGGGAPLGAEATIELKGRKALPASKASPKGSVRPERRPEPERSPARSSSSEG